MIAEKGYNSDMKYAFFGADTPAVNPIDPAFKKVHDQRHLYDLLAEVWCEYTCAPRLRPEWSKENRTLGQCSITSFLVQDVYGGEVYGVPLAGGGYHCYNVVGGVRFDLTSEQFGEEKLLYDDKYPQSRAEHFADEEKHERYLILKRELEKRGVTNPLRDIEKDNVYVMSGGVGVKLEYYYKVHYQKEFAIDTVRKFGHYNLLKYRVVEGDHD